MIYVKGGGTLIIKRRADDETLASIAKSYAVDISMIGSAIERLKFGSYRSRMCAGALIPETQFHCATTASVRSLTVQSFPS